MIKVFHWVGSFFLLCAPEVAKNRNLLNIPRSVVNENLRSTKGIGGSFPFASKENMNSISSGDVDTQGMLKHMNNSQSVVKNRKSKLKELVAHV